MITKPNICHHRERHGGLVYRTIDDLERIAAAAQSAKVGVVVGGSPLGMETANGQQHDGHLNECDCRYRFW